MVLTATVCVVGLVGAGRAGRQALAAVRAQQGLMGATGLAIQSAGTGCTGWLAGCRMRRRKEGESRTVSCLKYSFPSSYLGFLYGYRTACHNFAGSLQKHIHIQAVFFNLQLCWLGCFWGFFVTAEEVSQVTTTLNKLPEAGIKHMLIKF